MKSVLMASAMLGTVVMPGASAATPALEGFTTELSVTHADVCGLDIVPSDMGRAFNFFVKDRIEGGTNDGFSAQRGQLLPSTITVKITGGETCVQNRFYFEVAGTKWKSGDAHISLPLKAPGAENASAYLAAVPIITSVYGYDLKGNIIQSMGYFPKGNDGGEELISVGDTLQPSGTQVDGAPTTRTMENAVSFNSHTAYAGYPLYDGLYMVGDRSSLMKSAIISLGMGVSNDLFSDSAASTTPLTTGNYNALPSDLTVQFKYTVTVKPI